MTTPRIRRAFTLTELLVVIAITTILLGLLFIPIIQGFALTRKAQNQVQAQNQTRNGLERLSRELGQAAFVFDNTAAPINLPLKFPVNLNEGGTPTNTPKLLYAKIDFIPTLREAMPSGAVKDPTTGDRIGGSEYRFPLAPGTRVVRYFIGLRDNNKLYENIYQRPNREFINDGGFNPFVLYRAEFAGAHDPSLDVNDPAQFENLFNPAQFGSALDNNGGFNDPNFFYNTAVAPNGKSYAENWKAISSAVVDGPNQDLISWRKDDVGELRTDSPLRALVAFVPGTVVGDTATPGFQSAASAEVPNAVPTMYTTQQGRWVMPYTVTIYRAASRNAAAGDEAGQLQITVDGELQADGTMRAHVHKQGNGQGALRTLDDQLYCSLSPTTGKLFIKTPNLTYQVDPERGRIETGFPPLAGAATGAPLINDNGTLRPMAVGPWPDLNYGELVQTVFRLNTRSAQAGIGGVPTNQGLWGVDIFDDTTQHYYPAGANLTTPVPVGDVGTYASPFTVFGNKTGLGLAPGGGMMIAAGTETVTGPDLAVTASNSALGLVPYYRAPAALASVAKKSTQITDPFDPTQKRWTPIVGQRTYIFDQDTQFPMAIFSFDANGGPGLPARATTDPATITERELRLTYSWQNNYARRRGGPANGWPIDAQGRSLQDLAGGSVNNQQVIAPEPDVVKVDYSTRSIISVNFGVNVYDSRTHQATSLSLSDKVRINNAGR